VPDARPRVGQGVWLPCSTCACTRGAWVGLGQRGKDGEGGLMHFFSFLLFSFFVFPLKFCIWMHNQSNGEPKEDVAA
jgi:hypothetical protein